MSTAAKPQPIPATAAQVLPPGLAALTPDPAYPLVAPAPLAAVPAAAGAHGLTAAELAHFHAKGWVVKRGLFDAATVARVADEIDGLHERMAAPGAEAAHPEVGIGWEELAPGRPRRIRQLMGSQAVSPSLDAISRSDEVLAVMRQLIGPDVYLYHSKLMMKSANDGTFTPWHQDFQYWQYESRLPTQVNCMFYVDGADTANGCLRMIDGSQRCGLLPIHRLPANTFNIGLAGGIDDFPSSLIPVGPGDCIFFGSYVIHGSGPNTSDRHRRANTFAYDRPDNWIAGVWDRDAIAADFHRCGRRDSRSK